MNKEELLEKLSVIDKQINLLTDEMSNLLETHSKYKVGDRLNLNGVCRIVSDMYYDSYPNDIMYKLDKWYSENELEMILNNG